MSTIEEKIGDDKREEIWEAYVAEHFPGEIIEDSKSTVSIKFSFKIPDSNGNWHSKAVAEGDNSDYKSGDYVYFNLLSDLPRKNDSLKGRIVERLNPEQYEEAVRSYKSLNLEKLIRDLKDEIDDRVKKEKEKLDNERKRLKEIGDNLRERIQKHLPDWEKYLEGWEQELVWRESKLAELKKKRQRFEEEGGPEFMQILRSSTEEEEHKARTPPKNESLPPDFWTNLRENLKKSGYAIHRDSLLLQFVLSATVAAATGQFVVLAGPTGVGKTSLVRKMRQGLDVGPSSEKSGVVPVRPSWIDSTDLLGFYNPTEDVYEPTPFMDELKEAKRYGEAGEHYFLVLDEMNLSRIENYGADLLAKMEKARGMDRGEYTEAKLHLYSESVADRKRRRITSIIDNGEEGQKEEELTELRTQLDRYPARLAIPDGLVLFGTINADETTHPFSPKFKDRAFIIQLPPAELSEELSPNHKGQLMEKVWTLTREFVRDINPHVELLDENFSEEAGKIWKDIVSWNDTYLRPMEIHLSHRSKHLFRYYFAAAWAFGITSNAEDSSPYSLENVASTFALSKILPWISFHRDDKAVSGDHEHKREVLEEWKDDLREMERDEDKKSYPILRKAIEDTLQAGNLTYEYIGS